MKQSKNTRAALLEEARKLFACRGYAGASVRAITAAAGANLGAVTYHFGSKMALYHEVLGSIWAQACETAERESRADAPALDRIEAIVRAVFATVASRPDVGPLFLRELAEPGEVPPPVRAQVGRLAGTLRALITEGQADGSIVPGDAQLMVLSIAAQPFHVLAVRRKMGQVINVPAGEEAVFARIVDNAAAFVRRGLAAPGRNV
jgi:AcrR family transcriptional regulator